MKQDMEQRACAKCGSRRYESTARWSFVERVACLCTSCANSGWTFDEQGQVVWGRVRLWRDDWKRKEEQHATK
jgi:hypothetical protein